MLAHFHYVIQNEGHGMAGKLRQYVRLVVAECSDIIFNCDVGEVCRVV
jgi:hypothetical protein